MVSSLLESGLRAARRAVSRAALPAVAPSRGFAGSVARCVREARGRTIPAPVTDRLRFPAGQPAYTVTDTYRVLSFLRREAQAADEAAQALADDTSRELLRQLLAYRALGPAHVALPRCNPDYLSFAEASAKWETAPSRLVFPPFEMGHYAVPGRSGTIKLDCWQVNVIADFLERQYWFRRGDVVIEPEPGDIVIDAGGCFGDTALAFADAVGPTGMVYSFEPMPRQQAVFSDNLAANPTLAERIRIVPFAVGETSGQRLMFSDGGAGAGASASGTVPVETLAIDDLVEREGLERVDYIKMDVEGAETPALHGAAETIHRLRPKLGISAYHSLRDLVTLPQLIKSIEPSYELYLDHHTIHAEETVLYGIAR